MSSTNHLTGPKVSQLTSLGTSHLTGPKVSQLTSPGTSHLTGPKVSQSTSPGTSQPTRSKTGRVLPTYEEISEGSTIPLGLWQKYTDPKYWYDNLSENPLKGTCEKHYTTYFATMLYENVQCPDTGFELAASFQFTYRHWTADQFNQVNRRFRKEMIAQIEADGSYGPLPGTSYTDRLVRLVCAPRL
ncbi:hypothetical protein GGS24DRAFT_343647 [Hypoxylon argillaceum]|nr:hypothetical protein GGS24DRAFT_343647 [Hypoxylon argillaceum]